MARCCRIRMIHRYFQIGGHHTYQHDGPSVITVLPQINQCRTGPIQINQKKVDSLVAQPGSYVIEVVRLRVRSCIA